METLTYAPAQPSTFDPSSAGSDNPPPEESGQIHNIHSQTSPQNRHPMVLRSRSSSRADDNLDASRIELLPGTELNSTEQDSLVKYKDRFASKEFLLNQAEGLPTFVVENAYKEEETNFIKKCELVHRSTVPTDVNIIQQFLLMLTSFVVMLYTKLRLVMMTHSCAKQELLRTGMRIVIRRYFEQTLSHVLHLE